MNILAKKLGVFAALLIFASQSAYAYNLRAVNLGDTNFVDAAPPPIKRGWIYNTYISFNDTHRFNGANGKKLPGSPEFRSLALLSQFVYKSGYRLFGQFEWGVAFIIPTVVFDLDESNGLGLRHGGSGLGDIVGGPWFALKPIMANGRPVMFNYFEFDTYIPIGKYDASRAINPGTPYVSFEPYWSATVLPTPQWSISWRAHMLFNTKNGDTGVNPGTAFHINFASSVEVIPKRLRLGAGGYYLAQLNSSTLNGSTIANDKESVLGLGPGFVFALSNRTIYFFNLYFETFAKNRPQGYKAVFKITQFL